ncbi:carbonic anhydrase [Geoglobus sp.]
MKFGCAVNCIDGRTQIPVIEWMRKNFEVDFVDMITEPGIVKLFECEKSPEKLIEKIKVSVERHRASAIAVVAHHDCAGNPVEKEQQIEQLKTAVEKLKKHFKSAEVVGLWVNEEFKVEVVFRSELP